MSYNTKTAEVTQRRTRYYDVYCDNCSTELEPSSITKVEPDGGWDSITPNDGVLFAAHGGYGMYFDNWDGEVDIVFCGACIRDLIKYFPGFKVLNDPEPLYMD